MENKIDVLVRVRNVVVGNLECAIKEGHKEHQKILDLMRKATSVREFDMLKGLLLLAQVEEGMHFGTFGCYHCVLNEVDCPNCDFGKEKGMCTLDENSYYCKMWHCKKAFLKSIEDLYDLPEDRLD